MINTSEDFNSALSYVSSEMDYVNAKLSGEMNSTLFNYTFTEIENNINILYEKIRLLEDIKDYTKEFVTRAIRERRTKIIENLKVIETLTDELQSKDSIITIITPNNNEAVYDRDGTEISQLENDDGILIIPGITLALEEASSIVNNGPIEQIDVTRNDPVEGDYSTIDQVLLAGPEPFATCALPIRNSSCQCDIYDSKEPIESGLKVSYDIIFSGRENCNYINFNPVNCEILDVKLYNSDNVITQLNNNDRYFPLTRVVKATVIVQCKNYDRYVLAMPSEGLTDSFDKSITGGEIYA